MITIYYIEDDENISQTVKEFLEQHGYAVTVLSTIDAAREALGSSCPPLVLVDWDMPDGSGNLLCQWIRKRWMELPIIFLTVRGIVRSAVSMAGNRRGVRHRRRGFLYPYSLAGEGRQSC